MKVSLGKWLRSREGSVQPFRLTKLPNDQQIKSDVESGVRGAFGTGQNCHCFPTGSSTLGACECCRISYVHNL